MRKGKRWLAAAVSAAMIVQSLASVGPVYAADDGVSIADTFTDSSFRSMCRVISIQTVMVICQMRRSRM